MNRISLFFHSVSSVQNLDARGSTFSVIWDFKYQAGNTVSMNNPNILSLYFWWSDDPWNEQIICCSFQKILWWKWVTKQYFVLPKKGCQIENLCLHNICRVFKSYKCKRSVTEGIAAITNWSLFYSFKFHSGEAGKNQPHGDRQMLVLDGDIGLLFFYNFQVIFSMYNVLRHL